MLTMEQLIEAYWWPFPPPEGWIYDEVGLQHWIETTMTFKKAGAEASSADKESTSALWLAGATQSALKTVVDQHETINRLGGKLSRTEDLHTANRAVLTDLTEALVAKPFERERLGQFMKRGLIVVVVIPLPFPTPILIPIPVPIPEPDWDEGLDGTALTAIAIRCRTAATAVEPGPLQDQLVQSADRLFEAGLSRYK
ncbi:hypothetical protein [Nonomuraea sp. NPDC049784]|uniref:hypothetical protein n=1 Tax=Nonomuraea sp. NPDC049784 TaxID=3154361 RepID=UPI0033EA7A9D